MDRRVDKVHINLQMEMFMKAIGQMTRCLEKERILSVMEKNM